MSYWCVEIKSHKAKFSKKSPVERKALMQSAGVQERMVLPGDVTLHKCPACRSVGQLKGELIKQFKPIYEDESLTIDNQYLATTFKCPACDLHLQNIQEITQAGIEPTFKRTDVTSLHELFEPEDIDPYMNM